MIARNRVLYLDISGLTVLENTQLIDFLQAEHKKVVPNNDVFVRLNKSKTQVKIVIAMTVPLLGNYRAHTRIKDILISDHTRNDISFIKNKDRIDPEWNYEVTE